MFLPEQSKSDEVEHLLKNARLRDELEPLYDESIGRVNSSAMSTRSENDFLESMLEWERAPILPIQRWFVPELSLPHPEKLTDEQLSIELTRVVELLFDMNIVLDFTEHLTDFELYRLVYRDILPTHEKKIIRRDVYLHWDCADISSDPDVWLRHYASDEEREMWSEENDQPLPPHQEPPYKRHLPRAAM